MMKQNINLDLNKINTVFFDVDGIFTDGSLYISDMTVWAVFC